ncbi:MAG: hypothetical protein LBP75_04650 [Planctomycetota bacterium]|jgi:hypothetical protein|nr:hypothetical protein [Planctomycetota bacterium]
MKILWLFLGALVLTACADKPAARPAASADHAATSNPFGGTAVKTPPSSTPASAPAALGHPEADAAAAFNRGDYRFYRVKDGDNVWVVPSYRQAVGPLRAHNAGYEYLTRDFVAADVSREYRGYAVQYNDALMNLLQTHKKDAGKDAGAAALPAEEVRRVASNTDYPEYMFPALEAQADLEKSPAVNPADAYDR